MAAPGEGKGIDLTGVADAERAGSQVREPSTIAGILLLSERVLQSLGLDGQRVYALAGLDGPPVNNPLQRIPTAAMGRIMAWAVAETGDPLIGLTFGRAIVPQAFHALGYSLQASRHLLDFGTRLARHREALGCPVEFDRDVTRICYDRSAAELPFVGASDELAGHNDQIVVNYLARLDRADIEVRVKALASRSLPGDKVSKSDIAPQLHMTAHAAAPAGAAQSHLRRADR